MEGRAKFLGHPVHPMLIVLPLGLLTAAVVFDLVYLLGGGPVFADVGFWNLAAGIVGGLLAAVFGLVDWLAVPAGTRAKRVGLLHAVGNAVVLVLFAAVWLSRVGDHGPGGWLFGIEVLAIAAGGVSAWLGGELVDRLGVGVDPRAGLDAPSSLSVPDTRPRPRR